MLKFCQGYGAGQHREADSLRAQSTIPRSSCGKTTMKLIRLSKDPDFGFGMVITCGDTYDTVLHGAFVESVYPGSPAALDGGVEAGDQIISVNGTDVKNDHFLTVVDLLQYTNGPVDLVIGKALKTSDKISGLLRKEIIEKPFTKTQAWIVGNENSKGSVFAIEKMKSNSAIDLTPIPMPRKKWTEQKLNFSIPDLTLTHLSSKIDKIWTDNTDSTPVKTGVTRENIPDIIPSHMKHVSEASSGRSSRSSGSPENCDSLTPTPKSLDDNCLLPGEVFHVVLDKKGGSLGLNIYQGSENSDQRNIYIHSIIRNGAAYLDGRIKPGDKLIEVNGVVLDNLSYQEIVTKLRESPQVAHLVLQKGSMIEFNDNYNHNQSKTSAFHSKDKINLNGINMTKQNIPMNHSASNQENDFQDHNSYSSLPTTISDMDSAFQSAKDLSSETSMQRFEYGTPKSNQNEFKIPTSPSKLPPSLHNAKERDQKTPCNSRPLLSYSSTPNLLDNSDDEEEKYEVGCGLYRNRSTDCLASNHFTSPRVGIVDAYHNFPYMRAAGGTLHSNPIVPIRKKKLKKMEDIYNYCDPENTFSVSIRKSSRGLGLSISGGANIKGRDTFSQLISIRKLYPLQPALECGKLALGDIILEVNGTKMVGLTNTEALEVLRCAPTEVILKVFRPTKSHMPSYSNLQENLWPFCDSSSSSANSSLSRKERNSYTVENGEFKVTLVKRGGSLGFTISRKDNVYEKSNEGIFVKALVREPAVSDGRIQPGDKILQVNGTDISLMSHAEAIDFLRGTSSSVTLTLYRHEPPSTPGYAEESTISKPLRWEALELLSDRKHQKDDDSCSNSPQKRKIKRKLDRNHHAQSGSSTESESSQICHENTEEKILETESTEGVGLQRNQRPKSLDVLNSSDRKRCPSFPTDESFHRQSSVMCSVDGKAKSEECHNSSSDNKSMKNFLKWRGSSLADSEDPDSCGETQDSSQSFIDSESTQINAECTSDDEKPVPFPRTTSCVSEWVHTFDVELDRGWHGRLGFSLRDPLPPSDASEEKLPNAAEVKAVYPGSLADKDGRIRIGDRLLEVNQKTLIRKTAIEVIDILRKTRGVLKLVVCRLEKRA